MKIVNHITHADNILSTRVAGRTHSLRLVLYIGTVTGKVTIENDDTGQQYATLSFRQNTLCFDNTQNEEIEVVSTNIRLVLRTILRVSN